MDATELSTLANTLTDYAAKYDAEADRTLSETALAQDAPIAVLARRATRLGFLAYHLEAAAELARGLAEMQP